MLTTSDLKRHNYSDTTQVEEAEGHKRCAPLPLSAMPLPALHAMLTNDVVYNLFLYNYRNVKIDGRAVEWKSGLTFFVRKVVPIVELR